MMHLKLLISVDLGAFGDVRFRSCFEGLIVILLLMYLFR